MQKRFDLNHIPQELCAAKGAFEGVRETPARSLTGLMATLDTLTSSAAEARVRADRIANSLVGERPENAFGEDTCKAPNGSLDELYLRADYLRRALDDTHAALYRIEQGVGL